MKSAVEWNPESGELALVPGGPACQRYVAPLTDTERDAIVKGRKGYLPLFITAISLNGERLTTFVYNQKYNVFASDIGWCPGIIAIRRKLNGYYGTGTYKLIALPDRMERMDSYRCTAPAGA